MRHSILQLLSFGGGRPGVWEIAAAIRRDVRDLLSVPAGAGREEIERRYPEAARLVAHYGLEDPGQAGLEEIAAALRRDVEHLVSTPRALADLSALPFGPVSARRGELRADVDAIVEGIHRDLEELLERGVSRAGARAELEDIAEAIRCDVEELLNTRNALGAEIETTYPETARSVVAYGVEDIDSIFMTDKRDPDLLRARIVRAVERFEPRLHDVHVDVIAAPRPLTQEIDLEIRATIRAADVSEQVVWNSLVRGGLALLRRA